MTMMLMRMLFVTVGMKMHGYDNGDDVDADRAAATISFFFNGSAPCHCMLIRPMG